MFGEIICKSALDWVLEIFLCSAQLLLSILDKFNFWNPNEIIRNQCKGEGGENMPSITVKNIPDHAYEILKQFVTSHHRSTKNEI